jgi:hypothetical protein
MTYSRVTGRCVALVNKHNPRAYQSTIVSNIVGQFMLMPQLIQNYKEQATKWDLIAIWEVI